MGQTNIQLKYNLGVISGVNKTDVSFRDLQDLDKMVSQDEVPEVFHTSFSRSFAPFGSQ